MVKYNPNRYMAWWSMAEIYAKVALILGARQGLAYLERVPGIEGLIFAADSQVLTTSGMAPLLERVEPAGYQL